MTASERQRILNLADGLEQVGTKMRASLGQQLDNYLELGAALIEQVRKVANEETTHVSD